MLERVWRKGNLLALLVGMQIDIVTMEDRMEILKKLEIKPPYDPASPLLGIYLEETKTEKDTCTPMFIAAVLTIATTWMQPRCPLTDDCIGKLWYVYTVEYSSAIRMSSKMDELEPVMQSEVSHKEKNKYHILTHIYGI